MQRAWEKRNAYRISVGKPEGRPRPRWRVIFKMHLTESRGVGGTR
jgi:hypothetical protein